MLEVVIVLLSVLLLFQFQLNVDAAPIEFKTMTYQFASISSCVGADVCTALFSDVIGDNGVVNTTLKSNTSLSIEFKDFSQIVTINSTMNCTPSVHTSMKNNSFDWMLCLNSTSASDICVNIYNALEPSVPPTSANCTFCTTTLCSDNDDTDKNKAWVVMGIFLAVIVVVLGLVYFKFVRKPSQPSVVTTDGNNGYQSLS